MKSNVVERKTDIFLPVGVKLILSYIIHKQINKLVLYISRVGALALSNDGGN